ncbi:hypothetical protein [Sediminibacillus albus]|uniref:Uncharacterized protein n=1 Tax=Sediminibacillus albus TaxID=407036 RepID=A0A1G8WG76_9BACI|nr:hypothetical protein [Sediminibacillus albus]SDJ76695.1 hypothetical protein SAMN05216243_0747 [Sediminibacillus albus]
MNGKLLAIIGSLFLLNPNSILSAQVTPEHDETAVPHKWEKMKPQYDTVKVDTHTYTLWRNFLKKTRNCDISHKLRTDIWYCEIHNHTKVETSIEEIIHSEKHSH